MAEFKDREHFIPLRPVELVELLANDPTFPKAEREAYIQFCKLLAATFHFEYHVHLEKMKNAYAPFDPDADTKVLTLPQREEKRQRLDKLFDEFIWLLDRANFKRLSRADIEEATKAVSDWGINMDVDFGVFERIEVFARGDILGTRSRRRLRNWYRHETVQVPIYQRLVLILKQTPHKRLGPTADCENVYVKIFKDIPKIDLEMLLPGARVMMPGVQRLKLGGSLVSTLGYIAYKIAAEIGKLTAALVERNPFVFWGPLSLVLGYSYKQYYGYQNARKSYTLMLAQSLYYQNLDNNAGVLFRLLNEAEDQEFREAILAFSLLWRFAGEEGWSSQELDERIEQFLEERAQLTVDFEIGDATAKLERLGIVQKNGERYRALPLNRALAVLDKSWDNIFNHAEDAPARE